MEHNFTLRGEKMCLSTIAQFISKKSRIIGIGLVVIIFLSVSTICLVVYPQDTLFGKIH